MQHENLSDHLSPVTFVIGCGGERLRHFVARSIHLLFHCLPLVKLHEKLSDQLVRLTFRYLVSGIWYAYKAFTSGWFVAYCFILSGKVWIHSTD